MKVLILEDEEPATEQLIYLLKRQNPDIQIIAQLDSVERAVSWFEQNPSPDLAFFDIQLSDGLSFEVFRRCQPSCPVIFTTAYDSYTLEAFQANGIAYILKPIDQEEIQKAFDQYYRLRKVFGAQQPSILPGSLEKAIAGMRNTYKKRFVVNAGARLLSIPAENVAFFVSEHKNVWLQGQDGKRYAIDYTLEHLQSSLDPERFFRINRQFITSMKGILEITQFSNHRLRVRLFNRPEEEIITISREKVAEFKSWLDS